MSAVFIVTALCGYSLFAARRTSRDEVDLTKITEEQLTELGATRVDFETDPDGNKMERGADVSTVYVGLGCVIRTSLVDSYPGIKSFRVQQDSGQSCANHVPHTRARPPYAVANREM